VCISDDDLDELLADGRFVTPNFQITPEGATMYSFLGRPVRCNRLLVYR
jgi:hypothetical protein